MAAFRASEIDFFTYSTSEVLISLSFHSAKFFKAFSMFYISSVGSLLLN
jgi:hypothetical protein